MVELLDLSVSRLRMSSCHFSFGFPLLAFKVPTRCRVLGHAWAVLAGELVELFAAGVAGRLDSVTALVMNLLVITEKDAVAAGRAEGAGIGKVRLSRMRRADLVREHIGMALREVRSSRNHLGPPLPLWAFQLAGRAKIARAISTKLMFCRPTSGRCRSTSTSDQVPVCR